MPLKIAVEIVFFNTMILISLRECLFIIDFKRLVATLIATLRHMSRLLRLLPSGPGRVHRVSLRRDQKGHHNRNSLTTIKFIILKRVDYR